MNDGFVLLPGDQELLPANGVANSNGQQHVVRINISPDKSDAEWLGATSDSVFRPIVNWPWAIRLAENRLYKAGVCCFWTACFIGALLIRAPAAATASCLIIFSLLSVVEATRFDRALTVRLFGYFEVWYLLGNVVVWGTVRAMGHGVDVVLVAIDDAALLILSATVFFMDAARYPRWLKKLLLLLLVAFEGAGLLSVALGWLDLFDRQFCLLGDICFGRRSALIGAMTNLILFNAKYLFSALRGDQCVILKLTLRTEF